MLTSHNYQQQSIVNDYNSQHIHQQQMNNNQLVRPIPSFFNQTLPTNQQQVPPTQFHSGFSTLDPNIDQKLMQVLVLLPTTKNPITYRLANLCSF